MDTRSGEKSEADQLRDEAEALAREIEGNEQRFRLFTEATTEVVFILEDGRLVDASREFEAVFGYRRDEVAGKHPKELYAPEDHERIARNIRQAKEAPYEVTAVRKGGRRFAARAHGKTYEHLGRSFRVAVVLDVTERKRAEEAREAEAIQEELIRTQTEMLAQLSTPLLPIADGVVVLPLVGEINQVRATRVIETIVHGVFANRARVAIVDITGTRVVDAEVADMLLRAARAVQLIGARVVLTGVRPEAATLLVQLDKDLRGLVTYGTLQQGVRYALEQVAGTGSKKA